MRANEVQFAVIGAGISGLACAHRLAQRSADVVVLEASPRVGGRIETVERNGAQFEAGPNTLLSGGASGAPLEELIAELGLADEIVEASPSARRRYIGTHKGLIPLPTSPLSALVSPLLGPLGMLRAAGDLLIRSRGRDDETVAAFMQRRLGRRVLENFVAPFVSGIYAGDVSQLEMRSVFASIARAEKARGSVMLGMLAARRAGRNARVPRRRSITFRSGLAELPERLRESLGRSVLPGMHVKRITEHAAEAGKHSCTVELADGSSLRCGRAVIATSVAPAAKLVREISRLSELAAPLAAMPHASLVVVALLLKRDDVPHALDGFGYLNKPSESGPVLGCMFRSTIFPHAAPPGTVLLSAFVGGMLHDSCVEMDDDSLVALVREDLRRRLGVSPDAVPLDQFIRRWPRAIPQFHAGHASLRQRIEERSRGGPVSLLGNYITGLSLPECIAGARAHADRLIADRAALHVHGTADTTRYKEAPCAPASS